MFCNQCGTNLPDGTAFCSNCGAPTSNAAPAQPAFQAPVQEPVYEAPVYQEKPAAPKAKKNAMPVLLTFAVSMILIIASIISPMATAIYNIPMFSLVMGDEMEEAEEEWEDMADNWEDVRDELDLDDLDLSSKDEKAVEKYLKKADKFMKKPSVMNLNKVIKAAEEVEDIDEAEVLVSEVLDSTDGIEDVTGGLWIISIICFLPAVILALLAGLKKKPALTIVAMILTLLPQIILSGWLLLVLSLGVNIAQIVLQKKYAAA